MDNESNSYIINYYNKDRHTINNHINKIGLPTKKSIKKEIVNKRKQTYNKHIKEKENYYNHIDYNFFNNINTKEKAYYLGLIASDGNVYRRDNGQCLLSITLQKEDKYILNNFYNILNINRTCSETNKYCNLQISSKVIFDDLSKYGIIPNKTWNMHLKNIPKKFMPSFLLGYFDGDGSITHNKHGTITKTDVSICGTKSSIDSISYMLDELNLKYLLILDNRKKYKGEFYHLVFKNTTEKYCFLKTIYENNNDILKLKRKEERVFDLIYKIENNTTNRKENIKAIESYAVLRQDFKKSQDD